MLYPGAGGFRSLSMKLLVLDGADDLSTLPSQPWDMVGDCARAPAATYDSWARSSGAECLSFFDFAHGFDDLHASRELLRQGLNIVVDEDGVDWWDVLSLLIESDLRQLMLALRLSKQLPSTCQIYSSRPNLLASALAKACGTKLHVLASRSRRVRLKVSRYRSAFQKLEPHQLAQVIKDKFDPQHSIRRHFAKKALRCTAPVVLLPSAYINVSRTAAAYAASAPDHGFLLVCARESARLPLPPPNVTQISLNPYFCGGNRSQCAYLQDLYDGLTRDLAKSALEYQLASSIGLLARVRSLLPWGLAIRDSWKNLLSAQPISGVLCADDSNPYSRLPLILSRNRGLPTVACHHGALDFRMAVKNVHSDFYLTKSEMERDYLVTKCRVSTDRLISSYPPSDSLAESHSTSTRRDTLVFFSEPLANMGWREEEVFSDLIPRLSHIAQATSLKLVLKLHPFESARAYRRRLGEFLRESECVQVVTGPMSGDLWKSIKFAATVQSSVALECASRNIPLFLCGWLSDPYSDYAVQFSKFGIGQYLHSADDLSSIPHLIQNSTGVRVDAPHLDGSIVERLLSREKSSLSVSA